MSVPYYDSDVNVSEPTPQLGVSTSPTMPWPPALSIGDEAKVATQITQAPSLGAVGRVGDLDRISRAYCNIPLWLDESGNVVCPYCNRPSCAPKCMLRVLMESARTDLKFLEEQHARLTSPPQTAEDKTASFQQFCSRPDVLASISGGRLFTDFVEHYKIVHVVAEMGPWLFQLAQSYAAAHRGVGLEMPLERLKLRAERAVVLFLRLELSTLAAEDAWILQQVIESCGSPENYEPAIRSKIQAMMDLLTVLQAYFDHKGKQHLQRQRHALRVQMPPAEQDDPTAPRRCKGRTQSGVRCKLTEESVTKLHGRCAEAAQPLAKGEDYCNFHREQQFQRR
eukprot:TRINITY_DN244_c0_g1_i1.p1 TRINITY_DN244_c0_g1~~TRINITY_DN244_c0_g1_i1.p1  ORF type:complete len:338 (-),score=34.79 TRINITY_DN244_c0_g1_i1:838-1851(-)